VRENIRLIARLDIKGENLIKGVHLEGLRVVGSPSDYALDYYKQGADELIFMDVVASLYGRNHLGETIRSVSDNVFIPMTVGGGIRSVQDAIDILNCGADKVAVNTTAVAYPKLVSEISSCLGSQAMVLSIEAKEIGKSKKWEVYTDNGRESTGMNVVDWAKRGEELGAGEILLTSVDREGTRKGYDLSLIKAVTDVVTIPVIASGGMGKLDHMVDAVIDSKANAVAMADIIHFKRTTFADIREVANDAGLKVRQYDNQ
jgi:imidazole glycerol-phosphate synthase subunit HisF